MKTTTLTIRLPSNQRQALKRTAEALKRSESEYIRELLQRDLDSRPFAERAGDWVGRVDSAETIGDPHPLLERVRERNWRK